MTTSNGKITRRRMLQRSGTALAALAIGGTAGSAGARTLHATHKEIVMSETQAQATPTIVLVHGAFADASSWNGVIALLQAAGHTVVATANPLRGIEFDADYTASLLAQIPGPVLAVGHSYGGATITNAAARASNVVGLVYVAGFAPAEGEVLGEVEKGSTDSVLNTALVSYSYPLGDRSEPATEFIVDPARFHDVFSADLPIEQSLLLAAGQRPVAALAFGEPTTSSAWRKLPSWAVVATGDHAAGADIIRAQAERAGAQITEVEGSHVIMISQPRAVTDVILAAAAAVGEASVQHAHMA